MEVGFQMPVAREQVIEVAVEKTVVPDPLEQGVQKKPGVFDVLHVTAGIQQGQDRGLELVVQVVDQFVLGGEVVVQIARADAQFR